MNIKQGEIWTIDLNPIKGDEIGKKRLCLVVSSDYIGKLKLKTIVPITGWQDKFSFIPWMIKIEPNNINNLTKVSSFDTFQVKNVSINRFKKKVGQINHDLLKRIHETILKTFNPIYKIN